MLRSPLDQLRLSHPDLSTKIQAVAAQLDGAGSQTQAIKALTSDPITPEQVGPQRRRLAEEYHKLLAHVRLQPGFEEFLQPMSAKRLICAARNGPIVVLNCHRDRCDALLVLPGQADVHQLPLPTFTGKMVQDARCGIEASLGRMRLRERGVRIRGQAEYKDRFEGALAILWTNVVKPVLDFLGYMIFGETTYRILMVPDRVFDYVISSYTPTLTALLASSPSSFNLGCRVLGIGQANTLGHNQLPGTVQELAHLKAHVQNNTDYSQLAGSQATKTAVLDAMEHHDWVHLACHAHQNVRDPTKSGFFLHDGTLDLAAINRRSFKNKGLAFLSACQTAKGDEMLPEEAIHLASGMLMAGYPSVIATMWSVVDEDAPLVADKVYEQLMKDRKVRNGEAGKALHYAVAALREKVGEKAFERTLVQKKPNVSNQTKEVVLIQEANRTMIKENSIGVGSSNLPEKVGDLTERLQKETLDATKKVTELEQECESKAREPGSDASNDASPENLDKLGSFHFDQYRRLNGVEDLEKSLEHRSRALAVTPNDHTDLINRLTNLAMSYRDRYRRLGELEDLEKSLENRSRALLLTPDGHPDMPRQLADLGVSYSDRYRRLGKLEDLEKSLEYDSRALALTPDGHPDMPDRLADLAMSYTDRYRRLGDSEDLEKSFESRFRALTLTPEGHPDMADRLADIAVSYSDRYERLGELEDLNKALESRSRALLLTPDGHPDIPDRLSDLAVSYSDRYRRLGEVEDLEKTLEYDSRALALTPDGHPDMPDRLANLAASCTDRYRRLASLKILRNRWNMISSAA
ncbi:CHAT domain-containing protein [Rhizoctonia solani]|nr:CHAT domain-containing protein [Rhizoctonia solani]